MTIAKNFKCPIGDDTKPKISKVFLFKLTFRRSKINRRLQIKFSHFNL